MTCVSLMFQSFQVIIKSAIELQQSLLDRWFDQWTISIALHLQREEAWRAKYFWDAGNGPFENGKWGERIIRTTFLCLSNRSNWAITKNVFHWLPRHCLCYKMRANCAKLFVFMTIESQLITTEKHSIIQCFSTLPKPLLYIFNLHTHTHIHTQTNYVRSNT